jgi:hypothetical protein
VRYTHEDAGRAFRLLCQLLGQVEGYGASQWHLDRAPGYGGYIVVETQEGGGEIRPIWDRRLSTVRFCECVGFAMAIVEQLRWPDESWDALLVRLHQTPLL